MFLHARRIELWDPSSSFQQMNVLIHSAIFSIRYSFPQDNGFKILSFYINFGCVDLGVDTYCISVCWFRRRPTVIPFWIENIVLMVAPWSDDKGVQMGWRGRLDDFGQRVQMGWRGPLGRGYKWGEGVLCETIAQRVQMGLRGLLSKNSKTWTSGTNGVVG